MLDSLSLTLRMPAPASSTGRVQFGTFELDLQCAELRKSGVKIRLQEQPLKVLQILLENPGQIISREELQKRVWPADTFVEFNQGLYSAMARLRDALGDSSDSPRFIETVARRGYRFIAPVTTLQPASIPQTSGEDAAKIDIKRSLQFRRLIGSLVAGLIGGAILLALVLAFDVMGAREWLRSRTTPIRSIAVLPLENLSGDPAQDYFADGMTDELITDLAQLPYLRVISRTSVMRYKNTRETLPEIARELNVDAVVEGTVERSANRVRIRVQLIRAGDDRHLWAQAYERDIGDALSMQTDAAIQIANQVGSNVADSVPSLGRPRSMKPEAYDNYLKGRYYARTRKRTDVEQAAAYFREAIREDPEAALAYAGLADAYLFEFAFESDPKEAAAKTRLVARKALEIDPHLAEPHVILAALDESVDWNWVEAQKEYERAIELEPSSPQAHREHGLFLAAMGRRAEALAEIDTALKLDPLSGNTHSTAAFIYLFTGDYDRSIDESQKALRIEPALVTARAHLVDGYMQKGLYDQAVAEFERYAVQRDFSPESVSLIKAAFLKAGIKGFWQAQIDLNARKQIPSLDNFFLASAYAELGNKSKALDYLNKAYAARELMMEFINVSTEFRDLRSEPRFQELLRNMGLPPSEPTH